jgi:gas vesicle protein
MIAPAIGMTAGFAFSGIVSAIKGIYNTVGDINDFINDHIEELKRSTNETIARTGRVLEGAKAGFGIGYITPVIVIAVGQLLLGNPMSAIKTVATAATLTNPVAMTCAAFGAIIYGWYALSEEERQDILAKISEGLEIGVELIKSILRYVIDTTKELMSSKQMQELKAYIASGAAIFGKTLGDVTHKLSDVVSETVSTVRKTTGQLVDKTVDATGEAVKSISESADKAAESIKKIAKGRIASGVTLKD